MPNSKPVDLFTLKNSMGGIVQITNLGGIIVSIKVPDRNGELDEVTLGFDSFEDYLQRNTPHFGGIVGRYANRIANGRFSLSGNNFTLSQNESTNHLHGGNKGFDQQLWNAEIIEKNGAPSLHLSYLSADEEEGFPGNLQCTVTYTFQKKNELIIDYKAITDKKTVINLTNHAYFNLKDGGKSDIYFHRLKINADHFTPINDKCLPTGEIQKVEQTSFDFRNFKPIGMDIFQSSQQLNYGHGYDHNFVIHQKDHQLRVAAQVVEPESGRTLTVLTTEPGIQLYTGNWLDNIGKEGIHYKERSAFCLETQHFPDSPNHAHFPSTTLDVGESFASTTVYRFGVLP